MDDAISAELNKLFRYEMAWPTHDGLTHPNWELIDYWLSEGIAEPQLDAAWTAAADHWLNLLATELGHGYRVHRLDDHRLVTSEKQTTAEQLMRFTQYSVRKTLALLSGIASDKGYGPHVTIWFNDPAHYYRYADRYHVDDDRIAFGSTAGMCLHPGYTHVIINRQEQWTRQSTVAHEYAHVLLSHLILPKWVEEGLVQLVTAAVMNEPLAEWDIGTIQRHADFWDDDTLEQFWAGESFSRPDEGQWLSYQLALWIVNELLLHHRPALIAAINAIDPDTTFEDALRTEMGCTPPDLLPPFLRDGPG